METHEARVLFYCLGAGMGHLTRAVAIARKLKRLIRGEIAIITNSPFHYLLEVEDIVTIYLKNLTEINDSTGNFIREIIARVCPELIVVDSYPAGICDELLPVLKSNMLKKVLLRRALDETVITAEKMASHAAELYDLVIDCEDLPLLPEHPLELPCAPILIRDSEELMDRSKARDILMARNSERVVLGISTGRKEQSLDFFTMLDKVFLQIRNDAFGLRYACPHNFQDINEQWHNIRYFPIFELFNGIDILVGYYSYNLYHESLAVGVPTIFISPGDAELDVKLGENQVVAQKSFDDLEKKLREMMEKPCAESEELPVFENGAQKAAAYIAQLLFTQDSLEIKEYKDRIEWFLM